MKKIVVLTGAGMSAESGLSTFRDADGLWENYPVSQVATPQGWQADRALVQGFYNMLRKQLLRVEPNAGHRGLVEWEKRYDVGIITQNVDDLHERAGSKNVIHLHGELTKMRGEVHENYRISLRPDEYEIPQNARTPYGDYLRPDIVWFGEAVPMMDAAIQETEKADIFVLIGSSLVVYPAAGLLHYVPYNSPIYVIDPQEVPLPSRPLIKYFQTGASEGVAQLTKELI